MKEFNCALLVVVILLMSCSSKTDHLNLRNLKASKKIDSFMLYVATNEMFNGSALVMIDGQPIYSSTIGYADGDRKSNLTDRSLFSIGSVSKEFHAVSIMQLIEEGAISLDGKLSDFGLDLPAWSGEITIKHLLNNVSGLPQLNFKTVKSEEDLMDDLRTLDTLQSLSGTEYLYNHNIPILLKRIIELKSGVSFKRYVIDNILSKCDMTLSLIHISEPTRPY